MAAVGWSCTKEDHLYGDSSPQSEGAIAQARSFYERTAVPLTKSIGGQSVAVKPLPGEIAPLWDKAAATVLADGTTAWVDVPIEATVVYTAVRNGFHAHEAGESCGHDHSPVQAVQKLTVHTDADGTQRSLIATIVPEADCTAELNGFSSAEGLDGFSGFVSWHDLTGKLVRVAEYENGVRTRSAEPAGENEKDILDIVDDAVLYPVETGIDKNAIETKTFPEKCMFCKDERCKAKNDISSHCSQCNQYEEKTFPFTSNCRCRRCNSCGERLPVGQEECSKCGEKIDMPKFCTICGMYFCPHLTGSGGPNIVPAPTQTEHEEMFKAALKSLLTEDQYEDTKSGSYAIDINYQSENYEYMHGLYFTGTDDDRRKAHTIMRNHFISWAQAFIFHGSYYCLGKALHPIADTYVLVQTRVGMLGFYSYRSMWNIVDGSNVTPYTSDIGPSKRALQYIYNALIKLNKSSTEDEINAIFNQWLKQTGGGY
ncbi:hypothetical protein [Rikenella microfusus]|uniref:hypothetical protein n=1 Tax=Rikenella microfusus TaxID=28139 RepID=UPI00248F14C2|nr:hypothetical protein [Rikenella microfusus]